MIKNKALFIGLENTLILSLSGRRDAVDSADWTIRSEMFSILKSYYKSGFKIIIVTNKTEIEKGYVLEEDIVNKLEAICKIVTSVTNIKDLDIGYIYANKEGYNKKPNPGMAYESAQEFELDLSKCIMIGKDIIDEEFAKRSGIGTFFALEQVLGNARKL